MRKTILAAIGCLASCALLFAGTTPQGEGRSVSAKINRVEKPAHGVLAEDWYEQGGLALMRICKMPQGKEVAPISSWRPPDSLRVGYGEYELKDDRDNRTGIYFVLEKRDGTTLDPRLPCSVSVFENERRCRISCFSRFACSSMRREDIARGMKIAKREDGSIRIARHTGHIPRGGDGTHLEVWDSAVILHNNIMVKVDAPTNAFEIADALLEAGLKKAREEKMEEAKRAGKVGK